MYQVQIFESDYAENKQTLHLFTGDEQKFISINPFESRLNELNEISVLPENWDGYMALPVFEEIIETSKRLIPLLSGDLIERIYDIYPNPHGTISIEWINSKNEKLSLEIGKSSYSFFIKFLDSNPKFTNGQSILTDIANLTNSLNDFYREDVPRYIL